MNDLSTARLLTDDISGPEPELSGVRVLLVEDDPCCREALATALEDSGARVTAVDSVQEALRCFEGDAPAVLVSDIEMPGRDGIDLIREVRALDAVRRRRTPAIAVTGLSAERVRSLVSDAGFDEHVPKPVDLAFLLERIRALVP